MKGISPQVFSKGGNDLSGQGDSADNTIDESDPNASPAVRQFKSGLVMLYGFGIYNARIDNATGKPQVQTQMKLFRDGREVFTGKEVAFDAGSQSDLNRLTATGAIQLGSQMQPGEYVLQVIVTDLLRKDKYRVTSQWTDFEVVK